MNLTDILLFGDVINGGGDTYSGAKALVLRGSASADSSFSMDGTTMYRMGDAITFDECYNGVFAFNNGEVSIVAPVTSCLEPDDGSDDVGYPMFLFSAENVTVILCVGEDTPADETMIIKAGLYVNAMYTNNVFPTILVYGIT